MGVESRTISGPHLSIHCPECANVVPASSFQYGERATLAFVPVSPYTETNYVKCDVCGEMFVSKVSVFDLPTDSASDVMPYLRRRVPLVSITLSLCGILLVLVPVIGFGVNLVSLLISWRRRHHWTRKLSLLGTIVSFVATVVFLSML